MARDTRGLLRGRPPRREDPPAPLGNTVAADDNGGDAEGAANAAIAVTKTRRVVRFREWPKQALFGRAIASGLYRYLAYGGAIRGGKSYATLNAIQSLAHIFPRSRWAVVRQDLPTLRRSTIPTFEKIRLTNVIGNINQGTWTYEHENGSQIIMFPESLQHDPEYNRWAGLEVNGFLLEESNELAAGTFTKAKERAGAWIIPATDEQQERIEERIDNLVSEAGFAFADAYRAAHAALGPRQPPPLILCTFNPDDGWVRETFYDPYEAGTLAPPYFFQPATVKDNPALPQPYLDALEELRHTDPESYERFVAGRWGTLTHPNQLIPLPWLLNARDVPREPGAAREGVDIARYGDDLTVFAGYSGNELLELVPFAKQGLTETSHIARARIIQRGVPHENVVVDVVGMGGGVIDNLVAAGFTRVREFNGGSRKIVPRTPPSFYKFKNVRSQAYWEFREKLRIGAIRISVPLGSEPWRRLVKELTAIRYTIAGDREIEIESKEDPELRKRLNNKSPDYADAAVMGEFEFPAWQPRPKIQGSMTRSAF